MRYAGIKKFDIENGLGVGLTLFTQGCTKMCIGCHNKNTYSFDGGIEFNTSVVNEILHFFKVNPQVKRFTLSGGDPLENLDLCELILDSIKCELPYLKVWIYTGYEFEFLIQHKEYNKILNMCDVLIDGKFEINSKIPNLYYKGSNNQRIIKVKESLIKNKVILLEI